MTTPPFLAKNILNTLYANTDGYMLSRRAKLRLAVSDETLTYGEVDIDSFYDILSDAPLVDSHKVFYDLGSGTGKAVFAASLSGRFNHTIGIELLDVLYQESKRLLLKFNKTLLHLAEPPTALIDFVQGNLFHHDLSSADVIFVHSTCFTKEMLVQLEAVLSTMKKGSVVITVSTHLLEPFIVEKSKAYHMAWGDATIYFNVKAF